MTEQQIATYETPTFHPLALMPRNQVEALNLAKMMADSTLVPQHLQKKPADCLMVVMQSHRWGMDPFAVAQCTSVVHGRLCLEGKLVAAALYASGKLEGRLEYEIRGEGQGASITVTGTVAGTGKAVSISGDVKGWRTRTYNKDGKEIPNNWDKDPHSQLVYRGTRQWARIYCPEVMLGVNTPDELDDEPEVVTVTQAPPLPTKAAPAKPATTAKSQPEGFKESAEVRPGPTPKSEAPIEGEFIPADKASAAPFDDPTSAPAAQAEPTPEKTNSQNATFSLPPCGDGEPLSSGMARILETKCKAGGISGAQLAEKFPAVNKGNLNDVLAWAQGGGK